MISKKVVTILPQTASIILTIIALVVSTPSPNQSIVFLSYAITAPATLSLITQRYKQKTMINIIFFGAIALLSLTTKIAIWFAISTISFKLLTESILSRQILTPRIVRKIIITVLIGSFIINAGVEGELVRQNLSIEPQSNAIYFDPQVYQKAYFNFIDSNNYYTESFQKTLESDPRLDSLPQDLWSYRPPTAFILWKWLSFGNPIIVYWLFITICVTILFLGYKITTSFSDQNSGLLSPLLLLPYFVFASITPDLEFLQTEWWALLPIFIFYYALRINQYKTSLVALALAMITRIYFVISWAAMMMVTLLFKQSKQTKILLINLALFLTFFSFHTYKVFTQNITLTSQAFTSGRSHPFGLDMIHQTLSFATSNYLLAPYRLMTIIQMITLVLLVPILYQYKKYRYYISLLLAIFIPIQLSFLTQGRCCWQNYWGVMVIPFLLLLFAILVGIINHHTKTAKI